MKYLLIICLLFVLFMGGCTSNAVYWYRFDRTLEEAMEDCEECYSLATKEMLQDDGRRESLSTTMKEERLRPQGGLMGLDSYEMEERLGRCMMARGYRYMREDKLGPGVYTRCGFLGTTPYCVAGR